MFLKHTALAAAAVLLAASARAQVAVTADLGTTGAGVHLVAPLNGHLNARLGLNYFKHSLSKTSNSVDYDLHGKLQTADALLDWYPSAASALRLTGGAVFNGTRFDARADADGSGKFTLNGHQYNATDVGILAGKVDFRKAAPYLGIGWGQPLAKAGWGINADLGAFYQGKPNVTLANTGCTNSATVCDTLAKDVATERAKLQDDAGSYKIYPVLRASVSYRF